MIPEAKTEAVTRGLQQAFGVGEFEGIEAITKGHTSSLVFRIVVRGTPYLLKIILRTDDPSRHYDCMKSAAEAGLAPRVWYTSVEDKISITDFVQAVPWSEKDALVRMPAVLRKLHALTPFAEVPDGFNSTCIFLLGKGPAVDGVLQKFHTVNIFPKDETDQVLVRLAQVTAMYPHHEADRVSSHNDLFKPDNTLFDGDRVWLVDWEAAFRNDRYADLAVVANLVVTNDAEEQIFLQEYFGQPPNAYQRARFFLIQQLSHLFYAIAYLLWRPANEPVSLSEKAPEFRAFYRRIWAGEVNLADQDSKILFARIHWEKLLENMKQPRFDGSLRIASGRP